MSQEMDFFVYLLEHFAAYKQTTADLVLKQWDALGLTDYIYRMYWMYHTECLENAYEDIERRMEETHHESCNSECIS